MERNKKHYVHAVRVQELVNIGFSIDPEKRRVQLGAARFNPTIIATKESLDPKADERFLHWLFRHSQSDIRRTFEWFALDDDNHIRDVFEHLGGLRELDPVLDWFSIRDWRQYEEVA